jgi:hypothetical protein
MTQKDEIISNWYSLRLKIFDKVFDTDISNSDFIEK